MDQSPSNLRTHWEWHDSRGLHSVSQINKSQLVVFFSIKHFSLRMVRELLEMVCSLYAFAELLFYEVLCLVGMYVCWRY